jgi:hypothetical protein
MRNRGRGGEERGEGDKGGNRQSSGGRREG